MPELSRTLVRFHGNRRLLQQLCHSGRTSTCLVTRSKVGTLGDRAGLFTTAVSGGREKSRAVTARFGPASDKPKSAISAAAKTVELVALYRHWLRKAGTCSSDSRSRTLSTFSALLVFLIRPASTWP